MDDIVFDLIKIINCKFDCYEEENLFYLFVDKGSCFLDGGIVIDFIYFYKRVR